MPILPETSKKTDQACGGVDHEPAEGSHRTFAIALQQVVDKDLGLAKVGDEVVNARLEEVRQVQITTGNRRQRVVVDSAVKGEDATIDRLCRVMQGVAHIVAGASRCRGRTCATSGEHCNKTGKRGANNR